MQNKVYSQSEIDAIIRGEYMERGQILDKAKAIINGDRQQQYGDAEDSFTLIATFWQTYIDAALVDSGSIVRPLGGKDVAMMMTLMKIARESNGAGKEDNLIDACGYLALAADMPGGER